MKQGEGVPQAAPQDAPGGAISTLHPPLPSQVELASQTFGSHEYAVPPQAPPVHSSPFVQGLPSSHTVPSSLFDHSAVTFPGAQIWHGFEGFGSSAP